MLEQSNTTNINMEHRYMAKFTVCIEARQRGAIGIFEPVERDSEAENPTAALEAVQIQLNQEGLETRNPVRVLDERRKRVLLLDHSAHCAHDVYQPATSARLKKIDTIFAS